MRGRKEAASLIWNWKRLCGVCEEENHPLHSQHINFGRPKEAYLRPAVQSRPVCLSFAAARIHRSRTQTGNNDYPCLLRATSTVVCMASCPGRGTARIWPRQNLSLYRRCCPFCSSRRGKAKQSKAAIRVAWGGTHGFNYRMKTGQLL
jgi:hypothetical protein